MGGSLPRPRSAEAAPTTEGFRYQPDDEVFALDFDPRQVTLDLFTGWDREQEAYADRTALAFVSGPMYERYVAASGGESVVPLGDLKLEGRIWRGRNRSAARERAFLGIRHDGRVDFGYGELTPERERIYDTFIGGLHSIYNDLQPPPPEYRGAYSIGMGQQIRYFLPRIRLLYGLRADGRLEMLMSRDGLTLEQTRDLARQHGLVAAYLPDHASKSRFIVPGVKGFSEADANWISGGATSFVHVPYMLRLQRRSSPLHGSLLAGLAPLLHQRTCDGLTCVSALGGHILDRALAGFNRLMDQGVEPVARLFWQPGGPHLAGRPPQAAPLREPLITADPQAVQRRQAQELARNPAPMPGQQPSQDPVEAPLEPVELPPPPGTDPAAPPSAAQAGDPPRPPAASPAETLRSDPAETFRSDPAETLRTNGPEVVAPQAVSPLPGAVGSAAVATPAAPIPPVDPAHP
jgi:hypothetical protein